MVDTELEDGRRSPDRPGGLWRGGSAQVTWYTVCAGIVAHDKRIRRKTASCSSDTAPPGSICPAWTKMGVVYDEHLVSLLHLKQYQRTRSSPGRMPVTDQV
ncbi:MAG: hypothetical protein ACXWPS_20760 [Ktedonobacteraceae bacterium]